MAIGTNLDSITFTSNSLSPAPGIWDKIWLNGGTMNSSFNYCNIKYAGYALYGNTYSDSTIIKNSNFNYNNYCTWWVLACKIDSSNFTHNVNIAIDQGDYLITNSNISNNGIGLEILWNTTIVNCIIDSNQTGIFNNEGGLKISNSYIRYNQSGITENYTLDNIDVIKNCVIDSNVIVGIVFNTSDYDSLINNEIKYNGIGLEIVESHCFINKNIIENNATGIKLETSIATIYCNKICNNTTYNLYYDVVSNSNINIPSNYWCSTDSATIHSMIYDGYTNISLGLV